MINLIAAARLLHCIALQFHCFLICTGTSCLFWLDTVSRIGKTDQSKFDLKKIGLPCAKLAAYAVYSNQKSTFKLKQLKKKKKKKRKKQE